MEQPIQDAGYAGAVNPGMIPMPPMFPMGMNSIYGSTPDPSMTSGPQWMQPQSLPNFNIYSNPQFMSPANSAMASPQIIPGLDAFGVGQQWLPWVNMGASWLLGNLTGKMQGLLPDEIRARVESYGMVPWAGTGSLSGFDWFSARLRQNQAESMLDGGLLSMNPILSAIPTLGRLPMIQGALGGSIREALGIGIGQMGRFFGEDLQDQAAGAGSLLSALIGGFSGTKPFKLDDVAMFGSSLPETVSSLAAAANMGYFGVRGQALDQINAIQRGGAALSNLMPGSHLAGASAASQLARGLARGVNDFMAAGRGILGNDASAQDIISMADGAIGIRGMSSGEAAARLRDLDALGDTLNVDGGVIAKYSSIMRKMFENIGMIGKSGRIGVDSALVEAEAMVRAASSSGVDVSRDSVLAHRSSALQEEFGSYSLRRNQVLQNVLNQAPTDYLSSNGLIGLRNRVNSIAEALASETDPGRRQALRAEMDRAYAGLSADMQNEVSRRAVYYSPQNEALAAGIAGRASFTDAAASGVTAETDAAVKRGVADFMSSYRGRGVSGFIRGVGGAEALIERAARSGIMPALMEAYESGNFDQFNRAVEREFGGQAAEAKIAISGLVTSVTAARPVGPGGVAASAGDTAYRLSRYGGAPDEEMGRVADQRDARSAMKSIFDRIAGDTFRGNKGAMKILTDTALKILQDPELQSAEGFMDALKAAAGDSFESLDEVLRGSGKIESIKKIFSGEATSSGETVYGLRDRLSKLRGQYGSGTKEYREAADAEISKFIEGLKIPKGDASPHGDGRGPKGPAGPAGDPEAPPDPAKSPDGKVKTEDDGVKDLASIMGEIRDMMKEFLGSRASEMIVKGGSGLPGISAESPRGNT